MAVSKQVIIDWKSSGLRDYISSSVICFNFYNLSASLKQYTIQYNEFISVFKYDLHRHRLFNQQY